MEPGAAPAPATPAPAATAAAAPAERLAAAHQRLAALADAPKVQALLNSRLLLRARGAWEVERHRVALARALVSLYFFNVWLAGLQMWWLGRAGFPLVTVALVVPAALLVANRWMSVVGWVLLAEVSKDCASLLWGVFLTWWYRGNLYLNELMVKKLSMLGVTCLVIYNAYDSAGQKKANPMAGLLMSDPGRAQSGKDSAILLVSRLLLTSLFIWAGQAEIRRQLASVHDDGRGHQVHDRPDGDGHDQLWAKTAQFLCSLPLCLGLRTKTSCSALATVCVLVRPHTPPCNST